MSLNTRENMASCVVANECKHTSLLSSFFLLIHACLQNNLCSLNNLSTCDKYKSPYLMDSFALLVCANAFFFESSQQFKECKPQAHARHIFLNKFAVFFCRFYIKKTTILLLSQLDTFCILSFW